MNEKPCKDRSKKDIIDTACKELGLHHGLAKFKKPELVELCCNPGGPMEYLENEWAKDYVDIRENSLLGDILISMDKDEVVDLLRERPDAPSKGFWNDSLRRRFRLTKGNLFGNPVKCPENVPKNVREATMLATEGEDTYEYKDEIKEKLDGTFFQKWMGFNKWTWNLDTCPDLAAMFENNDVLMGDVTIEPCTVVVHHDDKHVEMAARDLDPAPKRELFKRETEEDAAFRAKRFKKDIASQFGMEEPYINEISVTKLASDPSTMKFFQERFDQTNFWHCVEPSVASTMVKEGKGTVIDRERLAFDDDDISRNYLERQRGVLPKVVVASDRDFIAMARGDQ